MTVLPESPVREYAERVEVLIVASLGEPHEIPGLYKVADREVVWRGGARYGLALAHAIVVREEPAPSAETTRFEYQAVGVDDGGSPERSGWLDYDQARSVLLGWKTVDPPFDALYIERRTVTVTEPVRLDSDGEPTS
jgi:hypothetical protein